jgi:type III pantothenate kinase
MNVFKKGLKMLLCLDIGNSQIHGGVFKGEEIKFQFRKSSRFNISSDEMGVFLRSVLRENNIDHKEISAIALCSVVPDINYSIRNGCIKYFGIDPFILQAGVKTGLKIKYQNPAEVGADRIANAIAATTLYPNNNNIIVIDFGTATTFDVITKNKEYLGGAILPGLKISMEALESKTAKLPSVEIEEPVKVIGRNTRESIQSGLFFSQVGAVKELIDRISQEEFSGKKPLIVGTGGFAHMFTKENLFDIIDTELVLKGIYFAFKLNLNRTDV